MGNISNLIPDKNSIKISASVVNEVYISIKLECITFIYQAHKEYIADTSKIFKADEIQITAGIYGKLEKIEEAKSYKFIYDNRQLTDEMLTGTETPKKAKLADITIFKYHFSGQRFEFDIEAKLLGEKPVGSYSCTDLVREYVKDAGMGKFLKSIYQNDGFMLGYIINGKTEKLIPQINTKIAKIYSNKEIIKKDNEYYISNYNTSSAKVLHHLFLDFP